MQKLKNMSVINLHLFDEGGTTAPVGQATNTQVTNDIGTGEENSSPENNDKGRRKAFDDFIKENKDLYSENTNKIVNKRFKELKELQEQSSKSQPMFDILSKKYGVSSIDELISAVSNDDGNFEEEAFKRGLTVSQYRLIQQAEAENKQLKGYMERVKKQERTQEVLSKWNDEANAIKEVYPEFNLNEQIANKDFTRLLSNGIGVKTAYEVLNMNNIKKNIESTTSKNVTNTIIAKGTRPNEGGSSSSFTVNKDVNSLSLKERQDLKKRIAKGEIISFG